MIRRIDNKRRVQEMKKQKMCKAQGFIVGVTTGLATGYLLGKYVVPKVQEECCQHDFRNDIENIKEKTSNILNRVKGYSSADFYDEDELIVDDELMDELADELLDEMMNELEDEALDDVIKEAMLNSEEEMMDENFEEEDV